MEAGAAASIVASIGRPAALRSALTSTFAASGGELSNPTPSANSFARVHADPQVLGLAWEDFDLDAGTATVKRQCSYGLARSAVDSFSTATTTSDIDAFEH